MANSPAGATNVRFMPGDAFFHFHLTDEVLEQFTAAGGDVTIAWRYPDPTERVICGYAGFGRLTLKGVDRETGDRLKVASGLIRDYQPREFQEGLEKDDPPVELNAPHVFVVPDDYNFERFRIGPRYNENWASPPTIEDEANRPRIGWGSPLARKYDPFLKTPDFVILDWRFAHEVAALSVEIPEGQGAWRWSGRASQEPVAIESSSVKYLIVPRTGHDERYLQRVFSEKRGAGFVEVDGGGVTRWVRGKEGWEIYSEDEGED